MKPLDLKGKRFDHLVADHLYPKSDHHGRYWVCHCDCGNEIAVRASNLTSGHTKSCGCRLEKQKGFKMTDTDEKVIYIITQGDYSEYHICAATTNRERAEKLRKFYMKNGDEAYIEEFIDDAPEVGSCENLKTVYGVLKTSSGKWSAWLDGYYAEPFKNSFKFHNLFSLHHLSGELKEVSEGKEFKAYVMAEDEEHAIKIAQDQMAKMLAEKEGL